MNNTLTAKEWLEKEGYYTSVAQGINMEIIMERAIINSELMEQYANYKDKVLEDKIKEFRKELSLWWLFDADGKKITKDLLEEYDKHFNIK